MDKSNSSASLMEQYSAIKQKYPEAILLFRVNDSYESYGKDAILISRELGITLTKGNNAPADSGDLTVFSAHELDAYLPKLVKAGHKVAVCDPSKDHEAI